MKMKIFVKNAEGDWELSCVGTMEDAVNILHQKKAVKVQAIKGI